MKKSFDRKIIERINSNKVKINKSIRVSIKSAEVRANRVKKSLPVSHHKADSYGT